MHVDHDLMPMNGLGWLGRSRMRNHGNGGPPAIVLHGGLVRQEAHYPLRKAGVLISKYLSHAMFQQ